MRVLIILKINYIFKFKALTGSIDNTVLPPKMQPSEMNINHYYFDYTTLSIAIVLRTYSYICYYLNR